MQVGAQALAAGGGLARVCARRRAAAGHAAHQYLPCVSSPSCHTAARASAHPPLQRPGRAWPPATRTWGASPRRSKRTPARCSCSRAGPTRASRWAAAVPPHRPGRVTAMHRGATHACGRCSSRRRCTHASAGQPPCPAPNLAAPSGAVRRHPHGAGQLCRRRCPVRGSAGHCARTSGSPAGGCRGAGSLGGRACAAGCTR